MSFHSEFQLITAFAREAENCFVFWGTLLHHELQPSSHIPLQISFAVVYFTGTSGQLLNDQYTCCFITSFSDKHLPAAV